ncbi:hypothetical protein [Klebsiella grimontii]|uniref:hypothetical protein n=1 Tax=Klebsiella grimontii TaxID=2058152 RepID=UPI0012B8741C|nr:hypothetical protein [Klebsiella grimontii]
MDNRYELANQHGMSHEFIDWFFDKMKDGSGDLWFVMMSAMWEGYKARDTLSTKAFKYGQEQQKFEAWWEQQYEGAPLSGWENLRAIDGYNDEDIDKQWEAWLGRARYTG